MTKTWFTGDNGNRASLELWGSEQAARESLGTLIGCSRCSDCSDCSRCSRCSRCSGCSDVAPAKVAAGDAKYPAIENIHKAIFDACNKPDALNMNSFHSCQTTHCRAGWAIHLAGEAGYALEKRTDSVFAAMQIYRASGYEISPVRFFDSNEAAMEDMRKLAES